MNHFLGALESWQLQYLAGSSACKQGIDRRWAGGSRVGNTCRHSGASRAGCDVFAFSLAGVQYLHNPAGRTSR